MSQRRRGMRAANRSKVDQQRVNFEGLLLVARTNQAIDIARAHGAAITDFAPWNSTVRPTRAELVAGLEYLEEWEESDPQLAAYGRRKSRDKTEPTRLGAIGTGAGIRHAERIQRLTDKLEALNTLGDHSAELPDTDGRPHAADPNESR